MQKDVLNPGSKTKLEVFSSLCFFSLSASSAAEQVSAGSQLKGEKRKASEEEEKNGREELVEKKVCKGFQTVRKQMYSICTCVIGLSKSRPKLSFGSSVCLRLQPLVAGSRLLPGEPLKLPGTLPPSPGPPLQS